MGNLRLQCECGNEILVAEEIDKELFLMYYYLSPYRKGIWKRLKFLFTGEIPAGEIILSKDKAELLAYYININIKTDGEKEKES